MCCATIGTVHIVALCMCWMMLKSPEHYIKAAKGAGTRLQRLQLRAGLVRVRVRLRMRVGMRLAGALLRLGRAIARQEVARRLAGAIAWMHKSELSDCESQSSLRPLLKLDKLQFHQQRGRLLGLTI